MTKMRLPSFCAASRVSRIVAVGLALTAVPLLGANARHKPAVNKAEAKPALDQPTSKDILVLFSGKPEELKANWLKRYTTDKPAEWKIQDGALVAGGGDIVTKQEFTDFHLHVEFKVPYLPNNHGQERGNSGIGLHGRYEVQVLDSFGIAEPGSGDCGAVYNQAAPLVNACKPPKEWQTYDITFRAPRFDDSGKVTENPRVTVLQNGIVVQNNQEIKGMTGIQFSQYKEMAKSGPVLLQDHGFQVEFRNIWIQPLPPHGANHY